jgi:hypothetical protein
MEQTQTQVWLGVLGDKRPTRRRAVSAVSEGKGGELPGTEQRKSARCQAEKLGENFPPNYFKSIG